MFGERVQQFNLVSTARAREGWTGGLLLLVAALSESVLCMHAQFNASTRYAHPRHIF